MQCFSYPPPSSRQNKKEKNMAKKKPKKFKRTEIDSDAGEILHRGTGLGTDYGAGLLSEEEIDKVIRANAYGAFSHVRENLDKDPNYYNKKKSKKGKMGGGHVKKYTGGKSGDKYYGGGPVYPRPTKGS
jgi:hypothetical protein